jgi:excisionase family DNA binding protein
MDPQERLMTPGEVATLFRVDPKTVTRWAAAGRIRSIRTPGGHRRFLESEVQALLRSLSTGEADNTIADGDSEQDGEGREGHGQVTA